MRAGRALGADREAGAGLRDSAHARERIRSRRTRRRSSSATSGTARARARRRRSCSPARSTRSRAARRSSRSRTSARVALPALRHRLLLNFEGEAEQINADTIVNELLAGRAWRRESTMSDSRVRRRLPEEARVPARRLEAGVRRAEPRGSARAQARARARVRRPSAVHARRRLPAHRLEGLSAAEPAAAPALRRRAGPADLPLHRREPVDGRDREVRSGAPDRGGAVLHRPRAPGPRHDPAVRGDARRRDACPDAARAGSSACSSSSSGWTPRARPICGRRSRRSPRAARQQGWRS